jgi:mannobiose 2-epimerase
MRIFIALIFYSLSAGGQSALSMDSILRQMRFSAKVELIDKYYPANIDSVYGGYLTSFTYDFKPAAEQDKMIVTQARHVWTTAKAALFYKNNRYAAMSKHGFLFLKDKMWDKGFGGFFTLVTREGEMKSTRKDAYGNAFGIFALAAYYQTTRDAQALELAKKAFNWLEKYSHDPVYKGYYQHLERNGTPVKRTGNVPPGSDLGYKDQNSSIHLLEAFTELYHVWPNALLKQRLQEMLYLIRDTMVNKKGFLHLFFTPDWKPISNRDSGRAIVLQRRNLDHISFGHDVETAYLMMEAAETLGKHLDPKTMAVGKLMLDHALVNGWDKMRGGFYDQAYYFGATSAPSIIKESKNWWAQAEGLNTLLIFSQLYPADPMRYGEAFEKLWRYVQTYLIDHEYGDWYEEGLDKEPERRRSPKAHIWKAAYHNFRALSNCIDLMEKALKQPHVIPK